MSNPTWPQVPLVDLCESPDDIRCGPFGTQLNKDEFRTAGVPLWGIKHVNAEFQLDTDEFVEPETAKRLANYDLQSGDLVMTRKGTIGNCAVYPETFSPGIMHSDLLRLRLDLSEADPSFLVYQLHHSSDVHRQLSLISGGAVMPGINVGKLKKLKVWAPPLAEQKRIAGILDAADALRAKRRESLTQTDTLLQSTFLDMFGDPVTNPRGWGHKPLGDVTSIGAPMVDPTGDLYRELLHYGPDRIEKDTGELLPALTAEEDGLISGKFLCTPGEILYSKIRPYLNKVALVKQRCLCSADVYPVRPSSECLTKEYLWVLLRSKAFLDYVAGFSRRANIPKLNRKQFAGYLAPLPPLSLQHRFADIVESVERQKATQRDHLAELDTLFAALQQRAFNGELTA